MTREIGEVFEHKNLTLMVVDSIIYESCEGCAFAYQSIFCETKTGIKKDRCITGACSKGLRKDKKSVIFKEVEQ